jgi:uncharacterized membrane protein
MLGGAVIGTIASLFTVPSAAILIGWDAAVVIYLVWVWTSVWRLDPGVTAKLAKREDPSTAVAELMVVGAGTALLVAVGFALVRAGEATGGMKAYLVTLGLLSVVLSWTVGTRCTCCVMPVPTMASRPAASSSTRKNRRPT